MGIGQLQRAEFGRDLRVEADHGVPLQQLDRRGRTREVGAREEARGQPRGVDLQAHREGGDGIDRLLHHLVEPQGIRPEGFVAPGFVAEDLAPGRRSAAACRSGGGVRQSGGRRSRTGERLVGTRSDGEQPEREHHGRGARDLAHRLVLRWEVGNGV